MPSSFNIMLSAAGRRVTLLRLLQQTLQEMGLVGQVLATDISPHSSAFQLANARCLVPSYSDPACLPKLLEVCQAHAIRLIVPTIDPDLDFYSQHRHAFEKVGTRIMVGSPETIRICNDKQATHDWLIQHGFPTMRQTTAAALLKNLSDWRFPLFAKPRHGASSIGAGTVRSLDELRVIASPGNYIVQELVQGHEYTVDVYVDQQGRCRCAVPRRRLETRSGEVSKGMTVRNDAIQHLARRVAEALPDAWGVMNIQVFQSHDTGKLLVNEINPRFGGGYPLTQQAGAPMIRWMLQELLGQPLAVEENTWADGLMMLRFDDAVFVPCTQASTEPPAKQPSPH